ncbi:MAG: DUF790 family protein [Planctomycetota bacterium]|nr:MAG: DUF790 family protein [Planctomycetota bacterium]
MLTREHAIAELDFRQGTIRPDRLVRGSHRRYLRYAEGMLRVYAEGIGATRRALHRAVHELFAREPDCPITRIDAFCKLLDDVSTFRTDRHGAAAKLRKEVFRLGAQFHPLVEQADRFFEHDHREVKRQIAQRLGRSWEEIDAALFADIPEFHRLEAFQGYASPAALLARYNVAQVQVALYSATQMIIWASDDFKTILRYAKLARLMHTIERVADGGYKIILDGPASQLRQTRKYGVNLARFLPALIACQNWKMKAELNVGRRGWPVRLELSSRDGLSSHLPSPDMFDSEVERKFAEKWGDQPRDGWELVREGQILHDKQKVFLPDFTFRHASGAEVACEIVGFWTPEYLAAKAETLARFGQHPILLIVSQVAQGRMPVMDLPTVTYKTSIKIAPVLEQLARFVER